MQESDASRGGGGGEGGKQRTARGDVAEEKKAKDVGWAGVVFSYWTASVGKGPACMVGILAPLGVLIGQDPVGFVLGRARGRTGVAETEEGAT